VTGEANFLVSFDIRQGGASGSPVVSIGLLSESAGFDVVTRDFLPFLLPGQTPSFETVTSNSTDASLRLPFNLDILDIGILSIGAGFEIIGYPTITATITGDSLTTTHDLDVFEIDRDLSPTPIQLYEPKPELLLETTYLANVQAFIGYVVNADLSFSVTLFGVDVLPISIPLFDQTFQLFSGSDRVDFPALEYSHPLPVSSVPVPNVDFGVVDVDASQSFTLPFNNDGRLELVGLVGLEGDPVFSAAPPELYAGPGGQDAIVVTFSPTSEGTFEATLYVETSDPVQPVVEVPLRGEAVVPATDDPFEDDNGTYQDNPGSSLYTTCGCVAGGVAPRGVAPMWGLMGLLLLGRRRQR
jgi:MYXO-CTERM domain-containing protein